MDRLVVMPHAQRNQVQHEEMINAAVALCEKLGRDLTWQDRHLGFDEWQRLVKALNAHEATSGSKGGKQP